MTCDPHHQPARARPPVLQTLAGLLVAPQGGRPSTTHPSLVPHYMLLADLKAKVRQRAGRGRAGAQGQWRCGQSRSGRPASTRLVAGA